MIVKIKDSTNSKIEKYIGTKRRYFKMYECACLEDLERPCYGIRTSEIVSEKREGNIITIQTKNSTYVLEVVEEQEDGRKEEI